MSSIDYSLELETLRHRLADRIHDHPIQDWSPGLLRAFIALMDIYLLEGVQERPATVLQLVRSRDPGPVSAPRPRDD